MYSFKRKLFNPNFEQLLHEVEVYSHLAQLATSVLINTTLKSVSL